MSQLPSPKPQVPRPFGPQSCAIASLLGGPVSPSRSIWLAMLPDPAPTDQEAPGAKEEGAFQLTAEPWRFLRSMRAPGAGWAMLEKSVQSREGMTQTSVVSLPHMFYLREPCLCLKAPVEVQAQRETREAERSQFAKIST